ncbi:MAG TPA: O-antigen ligase family protein [Sphingomicrobium sp.]|jgi:O-antigen ligase
MSGHSKIRFGMPDPLFMTLAVLLVVLLIGGGAARAGEIGQMVVRVAAALCLAITVLAAPWHPRLGSTSAYFARPIPLYLLLAVIALVLVQLVPFPPSIWQGLPGRQILVHAVTGDQPWRPLSIVPDATVNAAFSLLVPLAVLILTMALPRDARGRLPALVLGLIVVAMLVGVLQFSGTRFDNPLVNETVGSVSGTFANRNHFALFLALGCLIAPLWPFLSNHRTVWRGPTAFSMMVIFLLMILATGSRAGILVGGIAMVLGVLLAHEGIRRALRHAPRWAFPALVTAMAATITIFVVISVSADRAASITRVSTLDAGGDIRAKAVPTVWNIILDYLPVGAGFGSFDPVFRLHEPFDLLKPTYFNHAHNDFLEIVLDGGVPALLVLLAAIGWWAWASIRTWRARPEPQVMLGRLGSAMLLLVFVASIVDYPARTPLMMAMIVIAALWLSWGTDMSVRTPLPSKS